MTPIKCTKCSALKSAVEFYAYNGKRQSACKACTRAAVSKRRREKHELVCAYDRERSRRPDRKAKTAEYQRRMRSRSPEKYAARTAVSNAVRDGRLKREPCRHCGSLRVQAHHEDYSKPLDVIWECFRCHREHEHGQELSEFIRQTGGDVPAGLANPTRAA